MAEIQEISEKPYTYKYIVTVAMPAVLPENKYRFKLREIFEIMRREYEWLQPTTFRRSFYKHNSFFVYNKSNRLWSVPVYKEEYMVDDEFETLLEESRMNQYELLIRQSIERACEQNISSMTNEILSEVLQPQLRKFVKDEFDTKIVPAIKTKIDEKLDKIKQELSEEIQLVASDERMKSMVRQIMLESINNIH